MKKFDIRDALQYGWEVFKANKGFLISIVLISFAINLIPNVVDPEQSPIVYVVLTVLSIGVGLIMQAGVIKISLAYTYNEKNDISDLFRYGRYAPRLFFASFLYALLVLLGLILLIVPGIYLSIRYSQIQYFIVDQDMGISDAFRASFMVTDKTVIDLFKYFLLIILFGILTIFTLFLGLFVLMPVIWITGAYIYRELVRNTPEVEKLFFTYEE